MSDTPEIDPYFGGRTFIDEAYEDGWALTQDHTLDGSTWPWLVRTSETGTFWSLPNPQHDAPAHEQTGPLPPHIAARVDGRCGAPTRSGRPCRNPLRRCQCHHEQHINAQRKEADR